MSQLINGRAIAARITEQTASAAAALNERGITPVLAIVMPGDDPGAHWYTRALQRLAAVVGVDCRVYRGAGSRSAADVTICHSRTADLPGVCRTADILVAAAGQPKLIGLAHIAPGAVVIDVGTSPAEDGGLTGDVDTEAVAAIAAAVTPVPGGVGPVTTAQLMRQTVRAARAAGAGSEITGAGSELS